MEASMQPSPDSEKGAVAVPPAPRAETPKPERQKVSSTLLNFWLDVALGVLVTFVIWVSVMMQIVFPAPTRAGGWELWGLSYDQWRNAQFTALCVCGLLIIEHVVLHWKWVCGVLATRVLRLKSRPDEGTQAMYGIATFIAIMVILKISILAALFMVKRPPL